MNCVVLAGGHLSIEDGADNAIYIKPKALIDIGGRAMLDYVIDALENSKYLDEILVVGIDSPERLTSRNKIHFLADRGSLVDNALAAVDWIKVNWQEEQHVLFISSDIPTINGKIVDDFIDACRPFDYAIYYCMVDRQVMEQRFPGSNRSFVRLGKETIAGGDVILARPTSINNQRELMESLALGRKHAWKLARIVGIRTVLKLMLHRLTVLDVEEAASRIIGQPVKILLTPHPELAMDVDKPEQLKLITAHIEASLESDH